MQIGANDGIRSDPIRKYIINFSWSGILCEPQSDVFQDLLNNYIAFKDQLIFENLAISEIDGTINMYRKNNSGLTSVFQDQAFEGKPVYSLRASQGAQKLFLAKSSTFESLFEKHKIRHLDLLQIDAEGFDYNLIKMFPFDNFKPLSLQFEKSFMTFDELNDLKVELKKRGYVYLDMGSDAFAFLR